MHTRFFALATLGSMLGSSGLAQEIMSSPSGEVQIIGDIGAKAVVVGDTVLPLDDIFAYASLGEKVGNLVLVHVSTGGTACPGQFQWLDTTPGRVGMTTVFGTCSDIAEVSHDDEIVTVTMPSLDVSRGRIAYDFDGQEVTERMLGLDASGVAGNDPQAWAGRYAVEYLGAPENEAALIDLMGWEMLDAARNASQITSEVLEAEGEWLVAGGCQPHACNSDYAALALHRETGQVLVALKRSDEPARLFGKPLGSLPIRIRAVMTGS